MIYAVSDIHGCYEEFRALLKKIHFSDEDELYILGDIIDRGPDSVKLLRYIACQPNIYPMFGNHDYVATLFLPILLKEIQEDDLRLFDDSLIRAMSMWMADGAYETVEQFRDLSEDDRAFLLDFMGDFDLVNEVEAGSRRYLLVHSVPSDYHENRTLKARKVLEIVEGRPDFYADWNMEETLIIGHTPTGLIDPDYKYKVYQKDDLIDIDCGCVFGGPLAAYCLDTGEIIYQEHHYEHHDHCDEQ